MYLLWIRIDVLSDDRAQLSHVVHSAEESGVESTKKARIVVGHDAKD